MNDDTPSKVRFASNPERLDRDGLLALVRDLQRTVALQQQTIERQRTALASPAPVATDGHEAVIAGRVPGEPVASPSATALSPNGRTIEPVPGADYTIVFDGGSLGNPGRGYGSFRIVDRHRTDVAARRLEYGDGITNNGAEFRTLIAALEHLFAHVGDRSRDVRVAVRGDSQLVINGVTGRWKIKHDDLKPLRERAARLLAEFGAADVAWHGRDRSVRALGH